MNKYMPTSKAQLGSYDDIIEASANTKITTSRALKGAVGVSVPVGGLFAGGAILSKGDDDEEY